MDELYSILCIHYIFCRGTKVSNVDYTKQLIPHFVLILLVVQQKQTVRSRSF